MTRTGKWLALAAMAIFSAVPALAQQYPTKPIRLVLPFPPCAPSDLVGRMPYKGATLATVALMRGEVNEVIVSVASVLPLIRAGKVRPLAVLSEKRKIIQSAGIKKDAL